MLFINVAYYFFHYSASGNSAVAIDNKIEQAMVSEFFLQNFYDFSIQSRPG